jgi:hypothetical protein
MAILVDLHIIARANPCAMFDLFALIRKEAARAQGAAQLIQMGGQTDNNALQHLLNGVCGRAGFFAIGFNKFTNTVKAFLRGLWAHRHLR